LIVTNKIFVRALFLSAIFFLCNANAQNGPIRLLHSETVSDYKGMPNTTKVKGNVQFEHNRSKLFCDSAIFFQNKNLIFAYGNVQINQGDTVNLYCDSLRYDGNTNISKLMSNVRFRDQEYKMVTDSLEYDGNKSRGYYKNNATITSINQNLKLTSRKGYYYSTSKTFFFKDSVHLTHPDYEIFSDTMEFRTTNSSVHFHGPTIILLDSSQIECSKGIYFTEKKIIRLWNGATITEKQRTLYADSLIFDQDKDIGEGFCYVRMYDSTENILFLSDYIKKSQGNQKITLRDNAHIFQFKEKDTLYISADTIYHYHDTINDFRKSIAINRVSIINAGFFIACDSAYFNDADSLIKLHKEPIMWKDKTQLTADSIIGLYYKKEFHQLNLYYNSFITTEKDSIHYDQIKGQFMTAYLDSSKIKRVLVENNAQTLYYLTEKDSSIADSVFQKITAMNKLDCNYIVLHFNESDVERVTFHEQPTGTYRPINQVPERELFLKGYLWLIHRKPKQIFIE